METARGTIEGDLSVRHGHLVINVENDWHIRINRETMIVKPVNDAARVILDSILDSRTEWVETVAIELHDTYMVECGGIITWGGRTEEERERWRKVARKVVAKMMLEEMKKLEDYAPRNVVVNLRQLIKKLEAIVKGSGDE